MPEEPENLVLLRLRDLRRRLDDVRAGLDYLVDRVEALEVRTRLAGDDTISAAAFAANLERRVRRIEARLELGDG
jgi:hypothetical protein